MKTFLVCVVFAVVGTAAAQPAAKASAVAAVPTGAVQFEPGSYRYTDAQGQKWIYRRTPFGVARFADEAPAPAAKPTAAQEKSLDQVKATDAGDSVKFERTTPFGVQKWETKKTDLDTLEKAAWAHERERDSKQK